MKTKAHIEKVNEFGQKVVYDMPILKSEEDFEIQKLIRQNKEKKEKEENENNELRQKEIRKESEAIRKRIVQRRISNLKLQVNDKSRHYFDEFFHFASSPQNYLFKNSNCLYGENKEVVNFVSNPKRRISKNIIKQILKLENLSVFESLEIFWNRLQQYCDKYGKENLEDEKSISNYFEEDLNVGLEPIMESISRIKRAVDDIENRLKVYLVSKK